MMYRPSPDMMAKRKAAEMQRQQAMQAIDSTQQMIYGEKPNSVFALADSIPAGMQVNMQPYSRSGGGPDPF